MTFSFGQILIIVVVGFLLFGNLPKTFRKFIKNYSFIQKEVSSLNNKQDEKKDNISEKK